MHDSLSQACIASVSRLLSVAVFVCTSGCASAQIEFEEVEVTKQNIVFPGLPESIQADGLASLPQSALDELGLSRKGDDYALPAQQFSYSDAVGRLPDGITASMYAKEVVVKAHRKNQSLSFLKGLRLTVSDPHVKKGKPRVVFEYTTSNRSNPAKGAAIRGPISASVASLDSSELGDQSYELTVWCDLADIPHEPWALDVSLTLSGSVELDY